MNAKIYIIYKKTKEWLITEAKNNNNYINHRKDKQEDDNKNVCRWDNLDTVIERKLEEKN